MKTKTYKIQYVRTLRNNKKTTKEVVTRMKSIVDRFNNPLMEGQVITYPVRRKSFMSMEVARIESIIREEGNLSPENRPILVCEKPNGKKIYISRWDRCLVVSAPLDNYGF